jgi:SAM-dependent methyltransferase
MSDKPRMDREQSHFDSHFGEYEQKLHFDGPVAQRKFQRLSNEYGAFLQGGPDGPIVEIGAGTGAYTRHIASKCGSRRFVATDLSPNMLKALQQQCPEKSFPHMEVKQEDSLDIHVDTASVAGVTGHGILHHLPLDLAIQELQRVLKPGGRIAFYEPNILNPYVWLIFKIKPEGYSPDEMALNQFTLRKLLRSHGFQQIRVKPYELMINSLPKWMIGTVSLAANVLRHIPLLRYWGGSLKITAVRSEDAL